MKTVRAPAVLFATLYVLLLVYLWLSGSTLPERVATHFGSAGKPNGWMSRDGWLRFEAIFGVAFPLSFVAICWALRFVPRSLNIPHPEHWLAPGRREKTFTYLLRQSLWLACFSIAFVGGIHALVVDANKAAPARLESSLVLMIAAAFLIAVAVWVFQLWRHFSNPNGANGA